MIMQPESKKKLTKEKATKLADLTNQYLKNLDVYAKIMDCDMKKMDHLMYPQSTGKIDELNDLYKYYVHLSGSEYEKQARAIAELVESKQQAYGDSFGKSGNIMRELYPNGVSIHQMDDALTVVRIIDKLFRIATKKDAFGESPFKDIMGYSLLSVVRDASKIDSKAKNRHSSDT